MEIRHQTTIPVMRPRIPNLDAVAGRIAAVEASGWFANLGLQEQELRERLGARLGVSASRVVTAANATLGIAGAVAVLGGRRWLVPSFTFPATPSAVMAAGARPVLGDIRASDWTLAESGEEVDGVVPVSPFGAVPDVARWASAGRVVHDAAASLGAVSDLSDLPPEQAVVFSLHATKVLGSGEGGFVVLGDDVTADRLRAWTNFGFAGSREARSAGLNAKLSEVQACYVHAALDGWTTELDEWRSAREHVVTMCARIGVELFTASPDGVDPYAIARFPDAATTERVERTLAERGIETRRWWSAGCHRMPAFADLERSDMATTDLVASTSLGLPFFRGLSDADATVIGDALRDAVGVR